MARATSPAASDNSDKRPSKEKATTDPESEGDDEDGDEEEYEIEKIVAHKRTRNHWHFLIAWKGYPISENKWIAERHLQNAKQIVGAYKKKHKLN